MIGDWVLCKRPLREPIAERVGDITSTGFICIAGIKEHDPRKTTYATTDVQPIPLTPEILERNGWKWRVADAKFFSETWVGSLLLRKQGEAFRILAVSDYDDEDTNNTPFTIRYVHELQHALRMGGFKKEITL